MMRVSKFWIFLLIILAIFATAPEDILEKNVLSFINLETPFTSSDPEQIETKAYEKIYNALIDLEDEIYLSKNLDSDQVFEIRRKVIEDNPEIFYLDYEESRYWSNGKLEFSYIDTKENIKEINQMIEDKTNYVLSKIIDPSMSDFEKEIAIHDYIVLNTKYDIENYDRDTIPNSSYNVHGVLLKGKAVCEGYAKTFKMLLERVGIESIIISEEKINHAWNMVLLDGEYYHVDVTWNDPVPDKMGYVRYMYFNVSDKKMKQGEHIWDEDKYPEAKSEKYSYIWGKNGYTLEHNTY